MNTKRQLEIRGILADHADVMLELRKAIGEWDQTVDGSNKLSHAMVYVEKRNAEEIDLCYQTINRNQAVCCDVCGQWTVGEYCQCTAEEEAQLLERTGCPVKVYRYKGGGEGTYTENANVDKSSQLILYSTHTDGPDQQEPTWQLEQSAREKAR